MNSTKTGTVLPRRLLIANRAEIAIRIAQTASELGIETIAVHATDDVEALHTRKTDRVKALNGDGPAAYLDGGALVDAALQAGADSIHPGYGFLSEDATFAEAVEAAGLLWIGPTPQALRALGDKARAREIARALGIPLLAGTGAVDEGGARAFFDSLGPDGAVMVKAVAGGGGRGVRPVLSADALRPALAACRVEAETAFGNGEVYLERLVRRARHIEVQVVGDGSGAVQHLWERECTIQRRRQKLAEIAPAPGLDPDLRGRLMEAALVLAAETRYRGLGTFEFLVDRDAADPSEAVAFIEANARIQVEHTVTEAVTGLDLVAI